MDDTAAAIAANADNGTSFVSSCQQCDSLRVSDMPSTPTREEIELWEEVSSLIVKNERGEFFLVAMNQ